MGTLVVALVYSLCGDNSRERDWTLTWLSIVLLLLLGGLLYVSYQTDWPYRDLLLAKVLLLIGTMNTLFSTYDIWTDCVSRTVDRSDASKYAELIGCATPKCIGAVWLLLSVAMAAGVLLLALSWMDGGRDVRGVSDFSNFSWLSMMIPAGVCLSAIVFRLLCSQTYGGKLAPRRTRGLQSLDTESEEENGETSAAEQGVWSSASDSDEVELTTGMHGG